MSSEENSGVGCAPVVIIAVVICIVGSLQESKKKPATPSTDFNNFKVPEIPDFATIPDFHLDPTAFPHTGTPENSGPLLPIHLGAGSGYSSITFDNQSGDPALVRLVGPTRGEVNVPDGARRVIDNVSAGHYVIRARYGTPRNYRYAQGESFDVSETATSYSQLTITLHKVVGGNYHLGSSSASAFEQAAP